MSMHFTPPAGPEQRSGGATHSTPALDPPAPRPATDAHHGEVDGPDLVRELPLGSRLAAHHHAGAGFAGDVDDPRPGDTVTRGPGDPLQGGRGASRGGREGWWSA